MPLVSTLERWLLRNRRATEANASFIVNCVRETDKRLKIPKTFQHSIGFDGENVRARS